MKICLVNPPFLSETLFSMDYHPYKQPVQSPGLGYIAAVLIENGFNVDVMECPGQKLNISDLLDAFANKQYDAVGFSTYAYNFLNVIRIVNVLKKKQPNCFVFLGGLYPTLHLKETMEAMPKTDCIVMGEGEITCLEMFRALQNSSSLENIPGLVYRRGSEFIINEKRPLINDLDRLPMPHVSFISENKMAGVVSSRGCYANCNFCAANAYRQHLFGPAVRRRSAENVVEEILTLTTKYQIRSIQFFDDNFLTSKKEDIERVNKICDLMLQNNLSVRFSISARSNDILHNTEILKKMKKAGLEIIYIGIESFVDRQLKMYNKRTTVQQNELVIQTLNELDILYDMGLIILEPFTTLNEIRTNINGFKRMSRNNRHFAGTMPLSAYLPLTPIPGSDIYKLLEEHNLLMNNALGYRFIHAEVDRYYQITRQWFHKIYPALKYQDLIYKAEYIKNKDLYEKFLRFSYELKALDIAFLEDICTSIETNAKAEQDLEIMNKYVKRLDILLQEYDLIEDTYDYTVK